jgi:hypothetical protein
MEGRLRELGREVELVVIPDAGHVFNFRDREKAQAALGGDLPSARQVPATSPLCHFSALPRPPLLYRLRFPRPGPSLSDCQGIWPAGKIFCLLP